MAISSDASEGIDPTQHLHAAVTWVKYPQLHGVKYHGCTG